MQELAHSEGKGILLTSHYLGEVEELCNRVYVINKGEVILHDTPSNLILNLADGNVLTVYVQELPERLCEALDLLTSEHQSHLKIDRQPDGVVVSIRSKQDLTSAVVQLIYEAQVPLISLSMDKPKLEDAILRLESGAVV